MIFGSRTIGPGVCPLAYYGATDAAHACGLDSSPLAICADTANTRFPDLEGSGRTLAVIFDTGPAAPEGAGIEDNFFGTIPETS